MKFFSVSIITTLYVFGVVIAAPVLVSFADPDGKWPHPKAISFSDPNGQWPQSNHPQTGAKAAHHSVPIASHSGTNLPQHHVANSPRPAAEKHVWRPVVNTPRHHVAKAPQHKYPSRFGIEDEAAHSSHPKHDSDPEYPPGFEPGALKAKRKQSPNLSPNGSSKYPKTNS